MKILAVSDTIQERLYSSQVGEHFQQIDLVLGCGDLPYGYLEFLVSSLNVPLLYVPGNHDPEYDDHNPTARADGCDNIDLRLVHVKGLCIAGFGGSIRYQPSGVNQYSQEEMAFRVASRLPALLFHHWRTRHVPDIIIAHSPPRGIHDDDDLAHTGFSSFLPLLRWVKPRYFLHGHKMVYKSNLEPAVTDFMQTKVINVYPSRIIELDAHV